MLRHIIKSFSRNLYLNSSHPCRVPARIRDRDLFTKNLHQVFATFCTEGAQTNPFDSDDYIAAYKDKPEAQSKHPPVISRDGLLEALRYKYRMRSEQLKKMSTAELKFGKTQLRDVNENIDVLLEYGITKDSIVENPWILTINARLLAAKLDTIGKIVQGDINDVVPFLKLSAHRLLKVVSLMVKEAKYVPGGNRLYYISKTINVEPKVISRYLSRRLFMIEMPFEMLKENLTNMVNFGVPPISILRDLWAFRYTPKSVKSRLERAKKAQKDKIMPWMVRCPERILQRSLKISLDEKQLLGDHSVVDYVGSRLGYDVETMHAIMARHPATLKVRGTKIKEILDYLLDVEQFKPYEVANVIRILCHGLHTTRKRIEELKSLGCRPSSLVIVCRSKTEYNKFVGNWKAFANKNKNRGT